MKYMTHATTSVNPENNTLSERSQSQKAIPHMRDSSYIQYPEQTNSQRQSKLWLPGTVERRAGEVTGNGYTVSSAGDKDVLKLDSVDDCTTPNILKNI